jgi:hypothetical protein
MASKRIKEQIDYGDTPERMSRSLERKISDPQSPFAVNPAFEKKEEDVQRLITNRFKKVAEKLRSSTGFPVTDQQVQMMLNMELIRAVNITMRIESQHNEELVDLAIEASLEEIQMPEDWFEIDAHLGFDRAPELPMGGGKPPKVSMGKEYDVTLEMHKRNIINAIIQGTSKKGHYVFQKPEIRERLDDISPLLYDNYLKIMALNDFLYFTQDQAIENWSQTQTGVGGYVKLEDSDSSDEDGDGAPDTRIKASGMIFPILCHEIIKGLEEAKGRYGFPEDEEIRQVVLQKTDTLPMESWTLRIGPEIVEKLRFALPDEVYEDENKGIINWFQMELYKLPAEEFLKIIGNIISEDRSKNRKGEESFKEILQIAKKKKEEFEGFEPNDSDDQELLSGRTHQERDRPKT